MVDLGYIQKAQRWCGTATQVQYFDTGLGFFYASPLFTAPNNGGMDTKFSNMDLL